MDVFKVWFTNHFQSSLVNQVSKKFSSPVRFGLDSYNAYVAKQQ